MGAVDTLRYAAIDAFKFMRGAISYHIAMPLIDLQRWEKRANQKGQK